MTEPTSEQYVRTRTIAAPAETIFAVLADPAQHQHTEPGDWVRGSLSDAPDAITEVGQIFGIEMFFEAAGGRYEMHNKVTVFEPNRSIGWEPGQIQNDEWGSGGWWWRYDLSPGNGGTEVTLTYDWSQVPGPLREEFGGMPVFPVEFIEESLATLDRHVTGG